MIRMTLEDIRRMTDVYLTPAEAAEVIHMDPARLIEYARTGQLPFEVLAPKLKGARVRISRQSFLDWIDGKPAKSEPAKDTMEQLLERLIELETERNELLRALIERRMTA